MRIELVIASLALTLALGGCKSDEQRQATAESSAGPAAPTPEPSPTATPESPTPAEGAPIDRMLEYLPTDATRVAYQRLSKDFDADTLEVVFALPPQAGDLVDDRALLDEGLDITLDGDADPERWLAPASLAFTLPMGKSTFFLRGLSKPKAEVAALLEQGFTRTSVADVDVWLPSGSFPWRVALLDGELAAFIPVDVVGTGVDALLAAREAEPSPLETELAAMMKTDRGMELALFAVGPLVHFDVSAPIAQVNFFLRREGDVYQGQVQLRPAGDVQEAAEQLRARKAPEENQQVQALIAALGISVEQNLVVGQLELPPDRLKHLLDL